MGLTCIVPSAGRGRRLKVAQEKPFVRLDDRPILFHTLGLLDRSNVIDEIIVVVSRKKVKVCKRLIKKFGLKKVKEIVAGGKRRADSVRNGLKLCGRYNFVMIHDGVRPFIDDKLISAVYNNAKRYGGCVCGIPVSPTIKLSDKAGYVKKTLNRSLLWEIQTPQVFKKEWLEKVYNKATCRYATDDATLVERAGYKVKIIRGSYRNIKITVPEDLELAKLLMSKK